jgi:hypothetical protein
VAFVPGDSFDTLLKTAGADAKIFAALKAARVTAPTKPESAADQALLKSLSRAGSLIRSDQLDFAADELNNFSLAPKELRPRLNLALAQEKKGDRVAALNNYHQAALDEEPPKTGVAQIRYDAQNKYQSAQQRFQQHLAALRSSGSSTKSGRS